MTINFDVVVIGAGIAGLTAAYQLQSKDNSLTVAVIEAKDRVGGRTFGQQLKCLHGQEFWDLGGQWVGSCQPHIMALLQEISMGVRRQHIEGRKVMQLGSNRVSTYTADIPSLPFYSLIELHFLMRKFERMRKMIPMDDPSKCKYAAEWDSKTMDQAANEMCWFKGTRETIEAASRCMFGCELQDMSLFYYLMYVQAAGGLEPLISAKQNMGQEYTIAEGAFKVCHKLVERIGKDNVFLNQPVIRIEQRDNLVRITTSDGKCYSCERAILALPPHETVKIQYYPPLPIDKLHVLQRMPVGYITKVIVTYNTTFWRHKGYSGEAVTNGGPPVLTSCKTGPLNIVYDATSYKGSPALVAFIGGKQQLEYSGLTPKQRQRSVLSSLAEMFGEEAKDIIDYAEKNWNEEPYNGGGPVSVATPGVVTHIAPGLRYPFGRLHFAGTESATVWCGFMNGAVQSGRRAAIEVLYNMRPRCVNAEDLKGTYYNVDEMQPTSPNNTYFMLNQCRWIIPSALVCAYCVWFMRNLGRASFNPK